MRSTSFETPMDGPVGIIAARGILPFAVADAIQSGGRDVVVFGLTGLCDPVAIKRYHHHWVAFGKFGRLLRLLAAERCRDLVLIGSLSRPALSDLRFDFGALRVLPEVAAAFRGGDDHVLTRVARIFEQRGFRLVGIADIARDLLMPAGLLTRHAPDTAAAADIAYGREVLHALSPFDVGQAVVVSGHHVLGVEGIEGTDALLARIAQLRDEGRIRKAPGTGVLVKAAKTGQDLRFDLPTVGPRTIEGIARAQLGGLAVTQGRALAAEPQAMIALADRASLFVVGIEP